jgi:hypothetical protein
MTQRQTKDRTAELESRIAELERRLGARAERQPSGRSGMEAAFWALMHQVFPDEARRHLKAAGREQLLAARVYLDSWIARLERPSGSERERRETIEIE